MCIVYFYGLKKKLKLNQILIQSSFVIRICQKILRFNYCACLDFLLILYRTCISYLRIYPLHEDYLSFSANTNSVWFVKQKNCFRCTSGGKNKYPINDHAFRIKQLQKIASLLLDSNVRENVPGIKKNVSNGCFVIFLVTCWTLCRK